MPSKGSAKTGVLMAPATIKQLLARETIISNFKKLASVVKHWLSYTFWTHPLRNLIIVGVILRILLALFTTWSDMTKFWHMTNKLLAKPEAMLSFYPSPWLLTINVVVKFVSMIFDPSNFAVAEPELAEPWYMVGVNQLFITSPVFNFIIKIPSIICDLIVGLIIYHVVMVRLNLSSAKKAFAFWFFNPLVILISSIVGQNDVLVGLFMLVSLYFILKEEYIWSGASLGLSIFYKTYNAYVMPFFLLMITFELGRQSRGRFEHLRIKGIKNAIKFLGGFSLPYLLLVPSIEFFGSLWTSWIEVPRLSGFNLWGVMTLYPPAQGITDWAYSNFFSLRSFLFLAGLGLALIASLLITFRIKGDSMERLVYGIIVIISITLLTLPLANPHHIISVLPFLVLVNILYKKWTSRYWYLSLAVVGYIVLMRGPFPLFFTLGEFTPIVSINHLAQLTLTYGSLPGIINKFLNRDFMLLFSTIGFTILLSFLLPKMRSSDVMKGFTNKDMRKQGRNRMKNPLASIIISNYNGKHDLKNCLNSLARLRYPNIEVIVVDSGSSDGAPDMIEKEFPWVRLIRKGKIGIGKALNIGISSSKGDILVFDLNNDDVVSENWLDPLVRTLLTSPEVGIVCGKRYLGNSDVLDSAGDFILLGICYARGHGKKDSEKYSKIQEIDSAPVIATRRDVLDKVGILDEEYYIYGEDVDFCLRTKNSGYKILFIPDSVQYHKISATVGKHSPARLYYNARARLLWIIKQYPFYNKVPLLVFHLTFLPIVVVLYYTNLSRGIFFDFVEAQLRAIKDVILR